VRINEAGERNPLIINGYVPSEGAITLIFQEIGKLTVKMGLLEARAKGLSASAPPQSRQPILA
jgi:hypothetical protein